MKPIGRRGVSLGIAAALIVATGSATAALCVWINPDRDIFSVRS